MRPSGVRITTERQLETLAQQPVRYARQPVGGSPASIVAFTITGRCEEYDDEEIDCACVEAVVTNQACGLSKPAIGETIQVFDELGCDFNVPDGLLVGGKGFAVRMKNSDGYGSGCRWVVLRMCCLEES